MVTVDFQDLELYTICNKYRPELKDSPNVKHYLTLEHKYKNDLLSLMGIQTMKGSSKGFPSLSSYPKESVAALAHVIEEAERTYPNEKFTFYHEPTTSYVYSTRVKIKNTPTLPLIISSNRKIQISFTTPLPYWQRRGSDLIAQDIITFMKYRIYVFERLPLWILYFNKRKQPSIVKFKSDDYFCKYNELHFNTIDSYVESFLHNVSFQHGSCLLCRT